MRICFFGHRDFVVSEELKNRLIYVLKEEVNEDCEFLFGGYGVFDNLAYRCVNELRFNYKIQKTFVTPYITDGYLKNQIEYQRHKYDQVIYPEIEEVPYRFAISARNKWMVSKSDIIICYVNRACGGAYKAMKLAKSLKKLIINLGNLNI